MHFFEYRIKPCRILASTVWLVVVGHVMIAIQRAHGLESKRAGPISRHIIVLFEHNLFTLKGNGT